VGTASMGDPNFASVISEVVEKAREGWGLGLSAGGASGYNVSLAPRVQ
jgi:hypothetical protein